ncbi:uncharacterized protein LOC143844224 isoform X2 [Paroedura picta]|uniref:uncharacterized protein LOC143844224 isoform X2 n=1 Tax=Paroedura picta TaxID=143630 RepID=UPI00405784EC
MGNGKSRVVQGAEDKKGPRGGGSAVECGACEITIPRSERLRMVRLCSASFVSTVASQEELVVWHLFLDLILAIVSRVVAKHYLCCLFLLLKNKFKKYILCCLMMAIDLLL